jgi:hypothetical protein
VTLADEQARRAESKARLEALGWVFTCIPADWGCHYVARLGEESSGPIYGTCMADALDYALRFASHAQARREVTK